ncbi:MAG: UDP-3-O-(3-hydroxymyristoyl)glucosamine N-acyltransferase [Bacteroidales bacterium]|nr:UDP-3-O-(3-hydroxymyristoyl)glucosamine N-acyltransferase [Bacteroidales bacterium]
MVSLTAKEIAERIGGTVEGDPQVRVSAPARIEYGRPGTVCFYANPKYESYLDSCKADIIIVGRDFEPKQPLTATLIRVDDPYKGVTLLLEFFDSLKKNKLRGNRFSARWLDYRNHIAVSARIGRGTHIFPQVHIGRKVRIGSNCIIYPGVRIYHDCEIGDNCIIHANAVIGADGFGFTKMEDGTYRKIPQTGNVVIGNNVEIGAGTTVDRAMMGSTVIRDGVKIDNLCQIAHNVEIGENTVISAQCGIAGSTRIGRNCIIAGQSGVADHVTVADNTTIAARTGVAGNVKKEGGTLLGFPAIDYWDYMRAYAVFKQSGKKKQ